MNQLVPNGGASVTMTSLELVDFINEHRNDGEPELRHDNFLPKVPKVLGNAAPKFLGTDRYVNGTGGIIERRIYRFPKREACLMAMSYSYELQALVFDRMTDLEAKLAAPALPNFADPAAAARAWADEVEAKQQARALLEAQKPAVEFVERYVDAGGSKGFREVCKLLHANEREFREFLMNTRVLYKLGGHLAPFHEHIDAGRFEIKAGVTHDENAYAFNQTRFTPKGIEWIAGKWMAHKLEGKAA